MYQLGLRAIYQKDIKTAILEAKKNGFDFLEIHFSSPQFLPQNYTVEKLRELKLFAKAQGVSLQTHAEIGQSMIIIDDILREAEKKKLKRMVMFSKNIGARRLTLHPGKASGYYSGPGKSTNNDDVYGKYYAKIFEDSLKYITSIAVKDVCICIENTDNFSASYQKLLTKYVKTGKVFLTWDIMKGFSSYKPEMKLHEDRFVFLKKNIKYVRNLHISGPSHAGLKGYEKDFTQFFNLFKEKNIPMVIEIISLTDAVHAKNIIRELGY
jgi:sugar phosphate isomerase/epimerase